MLELIGRTDIPVLRGAEYPLLRTKEETELDEQRYGQFAWLGAWTPRFYHPPRELGPMPEGVPTTKPSDEDAAHFLVRMVHKYPHEVSIYEGGPMTNLALAISLDPEFPSLAKELVFMGASLSPQTDDPNLSTPPAANSTSGLTRGRPHRPPRPLAKNHLHPGRYLRQNPPNPGHNRPIQAIPEPAAQYLAKYSTLHGSYNYLWDELAAAAWLDPTIITKTETLYVDVNLDHGATYGDTLVWSDNDKPKSQSGNSKPQASPPTRPNSTGSG